MSPEQEAERLQGDVRAIRDKLGGLVGELDHRRHEALDWRLQLRRHAVPLMLGGVVAVGLVCGGIALSVRRARQRRRLPERAARLGEAMARMIDRPERVAKARPRVYSRLLMAAGTAVTGVLVRRLAQRLIAPDRSPRR